MAGTYFEGSLRGKVWIRDIYMETEKMMMIPSDFTDKIKQIDYNADKNLVFMSSRDGRFKCWKLPTQWGSKQM
jgi:1-deoxy-D-xylulose 5-phosphate reductoisomerase